MLILLADSGSTKTEWGLLVPGQPLTRVRTDGLNPYFQTDAQLEQTVRAQLLPRLPPSVADHSIAVFFYGAGCTNPDINGRVEAVIRATLPSAGYVAVASDMLGAARSVAGRLPGIVCILGTGANACFYDGQQITSPSYSLGFWLGDEGSGANLGKRLVTTFLHGLLPEPLHAQFAHHYQLDRLTVLDHAYHQPFPNRYFAQFAPFLHQHQWHPFVAALIQTAFTDFVRLYLRRLPEAVSTPVHVVGSVAYHFKPLLEQVLHQHRLMPGQIVQAPMEGLVSYHGKNE